MSCRSRVETGPTCTTSCPASRSPSSRVATATKSRSELIDTARFFTPLALEELDEIADAIAAAELEAVAICFLHAYAHPEHERACRDHLKGRLDGVSITASSDVTREWREYERTSTAVLNSYVQPRVASYIDQLEQRLSGAGLTGPLQIMQSNAGTATARAARERPIYLVESGPAGGVVGAARIGERIDEPDVLYLDIGGTTAKSSLVLGGEPTTTTEYRIEWRPDHAGYPVMVPVVDIVEIGAGGGSIAWIDDGGSLRVGAGAEPGPACYGQGGEQPTVTDAKLLAGVLDPEYFLGGSVPVSTDLAEAALARLGSELGHDARELANGIVRLLNANMINALKLVSVRRGYDPRDFVLVAGGGRRTDARGRACRRAASQACRDSAVLWRLLSLGHVPNRSAHRRDPDANHA